METIDKGEDDRNKNKDDARGNDKKEGEWEKSKEKKYSDNIGDMLHMSNRI